MTGGSIIFLALGGVALLLGLRLVSLSIGGVESPVTKAGALLFVAGLAEIGCSMPLP